MRLPTHTKTPLPSQAYLWECLREHSSLEVKLKVRRWVRGTNRYIGYYLHTPLGDFGKWVDLSPISPFHLSMWCKGRLPSMKKVQAASYTMVFDAVTLSAITGNTNHLKDISFELEGLQEMFGMNKHMRRISVSILGLHDGSSQARVGRFILTPEQVMKYTTLWEVERDARLIAKGLEARDRFQARELAPST